MTQADPVTLLVNGVRYGGWTEISVEAGIDRCVGSFDIAVTERWSGQDAPWKIRPFDQVKAYVGPDLVLTGRVSTLQPMVDAKSHGVRISGHSLTKQLVDCTADIPSGQFSGYALSATARTMCGIFGIGTVVETPLADQVIPNAILDRQETAFVFLERLGRLAGVLLCDDEAGNLVLTTAGDTRCSSALVLGRNVKHATATIDVNKRFSHYIIKGQSGVNYGSAIYDGAGGIYGPPAPAVGTVQTTLRAVAVDTDVPFCRPTVHLAESQMTSGAMQARANWMRQYAYGQSVKLSVKVAGFRQANGSLWRRNQVAYVNIPYLGIDADLLIARTKMTLGSSGGHETELQLSPIEGYTPDPAQVKLKKTNKGKGGGSADWSGAGS